MVGRARDVLRRVRSCQATEALERRVRATTAFNRCWPSPTPPSSGSSSPDRDRGLVAAAVAAAALPVRLVHPRGLRPVHPPLAPHGPGRRGCCCRPRSAGWPAGTAAGYGPRRRRGHVRERLTRDFEDTVANLAQQTDKITITRVLRCSWEAVAALVVRVVAAHIDDSRLDDLYQIGIDEASYRKGQSVRSRSARSSSMQMESRSLVAIRARPIRLTMLRRARFGR